MRQVPRTAVPDMPDRIVAATAIYLGVPKLAGMGGFAPPMCKPSGRRRAFDSGEPAPLLAVVFRLVVGSLVSDSELFALEQ